MTAHSPQEDEIALASMQPISFYHGLYFPSHLQDNLASGLFLEGCSESEVNRWEQAITLFLEKLQIQNPHGQVLIKNPVYTGRVQHLRSLFPMAKFIHIYRNPYVVFQSTRNFYVKLFRELALQSAAHLSMDTIDALIFQCYTRMMNALQQDVADLPPDQFVELRFEHFEQDPIPHVATLYQQLGLTDFDRAKARFEAYVSDRRTYRKNRYTFPQQDIQNVYAHWHTFIDQWQYDIPESHILS